jgi:hypothetical protein
MDKYEEAHFIAMRNHAESICISMGKNCTECQLGIDDSDFCGECVLTVIQQSRGYKELLK